MGAPSHIQRQEKIAGLLLISGAALALAGANSGLAEIYHGLLDLKFGPSVPRLGQMSVHHWVADGLMAIFFLLVGLEVKREWLDGRLSTAADRRLPIVAAIAGMAVPALLYLAIVGFDPALAGGWAIPSATDIAFAIAILALLGERSNPALKLLLVTIAIVDDVGAVLIIALAYTAELNGMAIAAAAVILASMGAMNRLGVRRLWPYLVAFLILWLAVTASGIHSTISGVLAALAVPLGRGEAKSPLKDLEHKIHPWVMLGIVPLFGFTSAGVAIGRIEALAQPAALGVLLGLFIGKQLGVFGAIWLADRSGLAPRPRQCNWLEIYGVSLLCGVGFTMSLFIGALAFPNSPQAIDAAKLGTLAGSLVSAILGYLVLRFAAQSQVSLADAEEAGEIFGAETGKDNSR